MPLPLSFTNRKRFHQWQLHTLAFQENFTFKKMKRAISLCSFNVIYQNTESFITVHNEVAKVMLLQASVCPRGVCVCAWTWGEGLLPGGSALGVSAPGGSAPGGGGLLPVGLLLGGLLPGGSAPRGVCSRGGLFQGGCLLLGWCLLPGVVSQHALRQRPPPGRDGHCCGRYASYWNAFLLK